MEQDEERRGAPLDVIAASLRRERDRVGLSLSELAKRAGIAKSTLSQLESGAGNPSVETLWALGAALGVPFSRLVDPPTPRVRVLRAGEGPKYRSEQTHYTATLLSTCPPGARRDVYLIDVEPEQPRRADPHIPGTVEHVVVSTGRLLTGPVDAPVELRPGDYASFPGDVPHIYQALDPGTSYVLVMEHV
ncbi:transcriptional regulator, XRE family with cupin sensor [Streptoalloteichus tenebrarius]|uniref:Transcriptional regulator, XRE family with cupin sensor n=1 Tax=Streptoalloteichus tenebrarius (strain ATCC 17920 / DSM 40477 / JCM 4838 / CBS 697.72 / NBRC 16177 / NCIMB 11028 / NRRL B-12390 / A12253. 1 / ISP 5477) TaxID=1933 RepID=A0ABT1HS76_STRSD|nr:XRE family transcriptional regulator [Streptoalloteichus tenebrarius]MCP2258371.1 transcriptional regulator, XRE family with cupin sensor [Streptoalloteichus tenebrarius]BFF03538.1 XRE family transcriptional regulator [Streptoalloteichus tenebrarius]